MNETNMVSPELKQISHKGPALTINDLEDTFKGASFDFNIGLLCMQYCMFADQLQYGQTIAGRIDPKTQIIEALKSGIEDKIKQFVNRYVEEYSINRKARRAFKYLSALFKTESETVDSDFPFDKKTLKRAFDLWV